MPTVDTRLTDWAVRQIEAGYRDDVCLLLEHKALWLEEERSGTGFGFYIPATSRANGLARTFIIDGIGHDLFPMPWERIEGMADLKDYNTTCLGDSVIVYARSESDRQRFESLQERLAANLKNPHMTHARAVDWLTAAEAIHRHQIFEERPGKAREQAGYICNSLFIGITLINGGYYSYGWTDEVAKLKSLQHVPIGFTRLFETIIHEKSIDEQKRLCHEIIESTRAFLAANDPDAVKKAAIPDFTELASWYQELSYTWHRVYHWCDAFDAVNAYLWGCFLQNEVDAVGSEYGLTDLDIMGSFDADDLPTFRKCAKQVEQHFVSAIEANGVTIDSYADIDDFLRRNP